MIWFPKIGDALESRAETGGVWSVVNVRRYAVTRDCPWERFELTVLCVVAPDGPYASAQQGKTYYISGSLSYIQDTYPCIGM